MADIDYTVRGNGHLMSMAFSFGSLPIIGPMDDWIYYDRLQDTTGIGITIGMAAMIDNEIIRIDELGSDVDGTYLVVARGCADTIPQSHIAGKPIWFIGMDVPSDSREYSAGETIGVKPLVYTQGGAPMLISKTPPRTLTFNQRFSRPYPPGNLKINGAPYTEFLGVITESMTELVFTWAHRDRLLQQDRLIGHLEASIGPEPGTTYTADVYDSLGGSPVATYDALTGTSWGYSRANAEADLAGGDGNGSIKFYSVRDGLTSLFAYTINIQIPPNSGLGLNLGVHLGS